MGKPIDSKTIRQWGLTGRIPKENAEPSYVWTINGDGNGKITSVYYLEKDTREMTELEKSSFEEIERKKHPNKDGETRDHKRMRLAYEKNDAAYKAWSESCELFNQRNRDRYYYRKGVTRAKRRELAEWVLRDFPKASFRNVAAQIGGCREIIWGFGLWKTQNEPYWAESGELYRIFSHLRHCPKDIELAIENPAAFSKKVFCVKAADVKRHIPRILKDIGNGVVW